MTFRPRTFRRVILAIALLSAALGNLRQLHARAAPASADQLPEARVPGAGERVLVFAPHPDDEVLALGGLLYQSRQRRAHVKVVYLTSGDGFRLCAAAQYRGWPSQKRMRQLAVARQAEAWEALARLEVSPRAAVFLGYPDRGLSSLWLSNWTAQNPYRSPHTAENAVSSPSGFREGAPFCGEAVLRDISQILADYHPDFVYYPDSTDDHPDHWAAHCLVQLALERSATRERGALKRSYLIHRGEWPLPMRAEPLMTLSPPRELQGQDVRWEQASLTSAAVAAKSGALAAYRSQQALAGNFLGAFVRGNELMARWPEVGAGFQVTRSAAPVSTEAIGPGPTIFGAPAPLTLHLEAGSSLLRDSTNDRFARARCGAVDFTAVEVDADRAAVRLAAILRQPAAAWATYDLYWKPVSGPVNRLRTRRYRLTGYRCEPGTTRFEIDGRRLEVTIPRQELGGSDRIMVSAAAWSGPALLDRTPWRMVTVR